MLTMDIIQVEVLIMVMGNKAEAVLVIFVVDSIPLIVAVMTEPPCEGQAAPHALIKVEARTRAIVARDG